MTIDQTINAWLAPVADWFGKVIFFSVPVAGAQLPLIMVWLIMGGIVCTLAFRFVNLRGFRHSIRVIRGDYSSHDHPGEASPFQALSTAVSGTVGLGSIGGVAIAVTLGGPGAAFWMVLAGFLGMSTKFAEVTLAVKHRIHLARTNAFNAIALFPRRPKTVGVVTAAKEAGAMAGREGGGFVEKEQFGPAPSAHHLAPPAPKLADAGDPGRARPALFQQGFCRGIVDDAAVAGEHAAMRRRDDVARGRDAVLQRHVDLCELG